MSLRPEARDLLIYLRSNKAVRDQIRAPTDQTLLYAGEFFKPMWKEIADLKLRNREVAQLCLLPDALSRLPAPKGGGTMKQYVEQLTEGAAAAVPWRPDGFTIWRALSGIFASNAVGKVYFCVGSNVTADKVLAATEIGVLSRNAKIDPTSRAVVEWLLDCIKQRRSDINFGLTPV